MNLDGIGKVGHMASEEQPAGVYREGFAVGSMVDAGTKDNLRGSGIEVDSGKELMNVRRMVECD